MGRNVIITGGELFNKGAQSMTFAVVQELRRRFPDHSVFLLSGMDYERDEQEKAQYTFGILPMSAGLIIELTGGLGKSLVWLRKGLGGKRYYDRECIATLDEILRKSDLMVDISGYGLSSQRGLYSSISYLLKMRLAKKYNIKCIVMPQSFGPFNYVGPLEPIMDYLIRKYMSYPEVIYAREREGYEMLTQRYGLDNVKKSYDLVLLSDEIELSSVYKSPPHFPAVDHIDGVGIVPNAKNFIHGNATDILCVYDRTIEELCSDGNQVYIIRHSEEDADICRKMKKRYAENGNVVLVDRDMSCMEYDQLVRQLRFVIASRYHSIIHAYRNGIPCIAIGWASKYKELLELFGQDRYLFDVREGIDIDVYIETLTIMQNQYNEESTKIANKLGWIQSEKLFDIVGKIKK